MRMVLTLMATLAASTALAQNAGPIPLRDMGSFHVGGRLIEVTGQPIKEVLFSAGGVPAKMDPERHVPGRADVRAVFPAAEPQG